jgi:hypothetical protein
MSSTDIPLESLTRRLAECPSEFLAEPALGKLGTINVAAVVADLIHDLGGLPLAPEALAPFTSAAPKTARNHLRLVLVTCWLLHDLAFREQTKIARNAWRVLTQSLNKFSEHVSAEKCVTDPDRREELVRLCLRELNLRPAGETEVQAQDRLATLNSAERQRVIKEARKAEARAQDIRRKMAEEAAQRAESKSLPE